MATVERVTHAQDITWAEEIDSSPLAIRTIAVVGYGNQGAAQAQNLRDSSATVVVGNIDDDYAERARGHGFEVTGIARAVAGADVSLLLLPDEVQPEVFENEVAPHLARGSALVVASGYNLFFDRIAVPDGVDVVMVAPRMIGEAVRSRHVAGTGSPSLVAVERDATGGARALTLALAKAAGVASPAISSSLREETAVDLFSEQALWPVLMSAFQAAYGVLSAQGFSDEAILYELCLSGEPAETLALMADRGIFDQLPVHSHTSQYGQLSADVSSLAASLSHRFQAVLEGEILSGAFARRWSTLLFERPEELERLRGEVLRSPLAVADREVRSRVLSTRN